MTISLIELLNIQEKQRRAQERAEAKRALKRSPPSFLDDAVLKLIKAMEDFCCHVEALQRKAQSEDLLRFASDEIRQKFIERGQRLARLLNDLTN